MLTFGLTASSPRDERAHSAGDKACLERQCGFARRELAEPVPQPGRRRAPFFSWLVGGDLEVSDPLVPPLLLQRPRHPIDFRPGALQSHGQMPKVVGGSGGSAGSAARLGADQQLDRRGSDRRADQRREQTLGLVEILHPANGQNRPIRQRFEFERHLRDDSQGAQRTGEQLAEIVTGHVLDDPAAPLNAL